MSIKVDIVKCGHCGSSDVTTSVLVIADEVLRQIARDARRIEDDRLATRMDAISTEAEAAGFPDVADTFRALGSTLGRAVPPRKKCHLQTVPTRRLKS